MDFFERLFGIAPDGGNGSFGCCFFWSPWPVFYCYERGAIAGIELEQPSRKRK